MFFNLLLYIIEKEGVSMRENLLNKKDNHTKIAEKYVGRYLSDLQKHFSLSDKQIINILNNITALKRKKNKNNLWNKFLIHSQKLFHKFDNMV